MRKHSRIFNVSLRYPCLILVVGFGLMAIVATGGGGSGGTPAPAEQNAITSSNAPQVASAVGNMMAGVEATLFAITLDVGSGSYCPKTLLEHADDLLEYKGDTVSKPGIQKRLSATASETENCRDGGSVTTVMTWDGPVVPTDCSQIENPALEFIFAYCQEDPESMNGSIGISYIGDLCMESPPEFSMSFNEFTYQNQDDNCDFTFDLTMEFGDIQYDAYDYMIGMSLAIDGTLEGTFDGDSLDIAYDDWTMTLSDISYNASDEITGVYLSLDGAFSGTIDGDPFDESYEDLVLRLEYTTIGFVSGTSLRVNGSYNGACLADWITIETLEPIFIPDSSGSPTSGRIRLSGNGGATIVFESDGSITITVDGEQLRYADYDDLPSCI